MDIKRKATRELGITHQQQPYKEEDDKTTVDQLIARLVLFVCL